MWVKSRKNMGLMIRPKLNNQKLPFYLIRKTRIFCIHRRYVPREEPSFHIHYIRSRCSNARVYLNNDGDEYTKAIKCYKRNCKTDMNKDPARDSSSEQKKKSKRKSRHHK